MKFKFTVPCLLLSLLGLADNASIVKELDVQKQLDNPGLYSPKDDIDVINKYNFKSKIYGKNYGIILEFYNSWCGFCQRFAPVWKEFGTELKPWSDVIKVAALDCSNEINYELCRTFEVMSYPTLRYFHENYVEGETNIGLKVDKGENVDQSKQRLLDRLLIEQRHNRGKIYPNLLPYIEPDLRGFFDASAYDHGILIVEEAGKNIGMEVALDLHKIKNVKVGYSHSNNTQLVQSLGVNLVPSVLFLNADASVVKLNQGVPTKAELKNLIKEFLATKGIKVYEARVKNSNWKDADEGKLSPEQKQLQDKIKLMGDVVFQADLENALRYSLKRDVASKKSIQGESLQALRNYLGVLQDYFPFGKEGQEFLKKLGEVVNSSDVQGVELYKLIKEAEAVDRKVYSSPPKWLGCMGSDPTHRGYPCGMWKLFHYLTMRHYEATFESKLGDPVRVLEAMHGFIKYFFGCTDCSQHFQDMAERLNYKGVVSSKAAVLWLWMAHNEVNDRLAGDETEDPEYPKVQFPTYERCPTCRSANKWNAEAVFNYLRQVYGRINVRYLGTDAEVLHMGLEGNSTAGSSPFMSKLDASMCLILYVASFVLLITLIRMFLRKGYKKKKYVHDLLGKV